MTASPAPHSWGMIGQDGEVLALQRSLASGRPAHAYLFVGPPRSGKARLASRLAQALNCTAAAEPGTACGSCRACRHIEEGKHPDVEVIRPGGLCDDSSHDHGKDNSKDIKICQVRSLERRLSVSPFEGRYRIVIIDPADALNVIAADAFLKTLEEPPAQVMLILLTAKEEALSETVRSRLRLVTVRPAPMPMLEAALAERGAGPVQAALVARLSRGCTGWALSAIKDTRLLEERSRLLDELAALGSSGRFERFAFAAELATRWSRDRAGVLAVLGTWTEWWRDLTLSAVGSERGILNVDRIEEIRAAARGLRVADAAAFAQALRDVRGQLEENASARLALEVLMLGVPEPHMRSA